MYYFWTQSFTPHHLQQISAAWKTAADTLESTSKFYASNPAVSLIIAAGADIARNARDITDQIAGDLPLIPEHIAEALSLGPHQNPILTASDRQTARNIEREVKRGIAGLGPSPRLGTL